MTKIRFESRESRFIRFGRKEHLFCCGCGAETRHLPVAQMAALLAVTERTIFRLAESEQVHSLETPEGYLMICTESSAIFRVAGGEVKVLEIGDI